MRIRLTVRYDGTDFAGSQVQPGKRTVAGTLKAGLETLIQQEVKLDFASRTDAGVHAEGNVAAFDAALPFSVDKLPIVIGPMMPPDLVVVSAEEAPGGFHPRFDAIRREYTYCCYLGESQPVRYVRYSALLPGEISWRAIEAALESIEGHHKFAAFTTNGLPADKTYCDLECRVANSDGMAVFHFSANRFLRHMIVRLMGTLIAVGQGKLEKWELLEALENERRIQFRPAPAKGLTLVAVQYE